MKKNIHPENYRLVVFKDTSCDYSFLTKSTEKQKIQLFGMMGMNIHFII